jgi:3-hydroxyisobutyrate dehydrogenase-like beta-hydroxyacid dehydrogenase
MMVFDLAPDRLADCVAAGAAAATNAPDLVERCEVVLASLPSSAAFVQAAEIDLLPHARSGQVFLDMGTTEAPETRRLAAAFAAKGADLLDCPVSGGSGGAAAGTLHVFVGGQRAAYERCRPILEVLGEPRRIARCGPSGCGQAVKGVNQLAMGLVAAAYLEAISFGVRAGADLEAIAQAVGGEEDWRRRVASYARLIAEGRGEDVLIKFPELPYFLREARERGFVLPMTEALFAFCNPGPRNWADNMGRPRVSFWHQLVCAGEPREAR